MRWALFGPTPGNRPSSSIRSWTTPSYTTGSLRPRADVHGRRAPTARRVGLGAHSSVSSMTRPPSSRSTTGRPTRSLSSTSSSSALGSSSCERDRATLSGRRYWLPPPRPARAGSDRSAGRLATGRWLARRLRSAAAVGSGGGLVQAPVRGRARARSAGRRPNRDGLGGTRRTARSPGGWRRALASGSPPARACAAEAAAPTRHPAAAVGRESPCTASTWASSASTSISACRTNSPCAPARKLAAAPSEAMPERHPAPVEGEHLRVLDQHEGHLLHAEELRGDVRPGVPDRLDVQRPGARGRGGWPDRLRDRRRLGRRRGPWASLDDGRLLDRGRGHRLRGRGRHGDRLASGLGGGPPAARRRGWATAGSRRAAAAAAGGCRDRQPALDPVQPSAVPRLAVGGRQQHASAEQLELQPRRGRSGQLGQPVVDDVGSTRELRRHRTGWPGRASARAGPPAGRAGSTPRPRAPR